MMPEANKISKTKTKNKKNGKSKTNTKTSIIKKNKNKQLPPSRRNEIWETLSDDQSESPSSPTDVMGEIDDWSEGVGEDPLTISQQQQRRGSMSSRVDMSGSIHSSPNLMDDDDDDSSVEVLQGPRGGGGGGLPDAPFVSTRIDNVDDGNKHKKPASEMSLKELKAELVSYGIPPENFLEKIEMIKAVKDARKAREGASNKEAETLNNQGDDTLRSRNVPAAPVPAAVAAAANRFQKHEDVLYRSSDGTTEVATILKIHLDDDLVPFYDIRLKDSGKEKQTDDGHLSPLPKDRQQPNSGAAADDGHIPDSIAFSLDEDAAAYGEYDIDMSTRSRSENPSYSEIDDSSEYYADHQSHRSSRSAGPIIDNSTRSRRSTGPIENSIRSRRSAASAPRAKRNSMEAASTPHQNNKARVRNSDFVSGYNTPSSSSSQRRGSSHNMSPTRPPRRNVSPTRPPQQQRSSNAASSPTRPPSCRRRDSSEMNSNHGGGARSSFHLNNNVSSSPTRPPSCRRRNSSEMMDGGHNATRPPSCRRRDSSEMNSNHGSGRPTSSSIRSSARSPTRASARSPTTRSSATSPTRTSSIKNNNNGGRPSATTSPTRRSPAGGGRARTVRSKSPVPINGRRSANRHHSAPLSPAKSPNKNKSIRTTTQTTTSPTRNRTTTAPAHSISRLKKRMSS